MSHVRTCILLLQVCAVVLAGCASARRSTSSPADAPESFTATGVDVIPERWWTAFGDADLNATVNRALEANLELRAVWERLRESRAVARSEGAGLYPTLEVSAGAEAERFSGGEADEAVDLGAFASYEVDLWGRVRSRADAGHLRAEASLSSYEAAALSLSAEIVRAWYQLAEALEQQALLLEQVETNRSVLSLLEVRLGIGQVRSVDILRQRQLVASTQEQFARAASRSDVLVHRLAVLLGRPPGEAIQTASGGWPNVPPLPETGIPSDLVRRRPDVKSAYLRLQAADHDLAAAVSDQYPRLSLSASGTTSSGGAGGLFDNWVTSLAGNLIAPIFTGGERRAEVDRRSAMKQQRLYEYGQAVLESFQDVEDALVLETRQSEALALLEMQADLARQSYDQLRVEYLNGATTYLDVLTALVQIQRLQRDFLTARRVLLEHRVALYLALAGPLEDSEPAPLR